jgi:hypothetical protein
MTHVNRIKIAPARALPGTQPAHNSNACHRRMNEIIGAALSCLFLVFAGCSPTVATTADLKPAPMAQTASGLTDAARATTQGISFLVQAEDWPGPVDIQKAVTPLKIRIENQGPQPVQIRYNEFALISSENRTFSALPLSRIEGEVAVPVRNLHSPRFYHRNFHVAPHYAGIYTEITPYHRHFAFDPYYNTTYYGYWENRELPTSEMISRIVPEGVITSGGMLEGWLFFEKVDPGDVNRVIFRSDLVNAETGKKFAELRIPFVVK